MNEILYRTLDAGHGALMIALLFFAGRLLLTRREGMVKIRTIAGLYLAVCCVQILGLFLLDDTNPTEARTEWFSLAMDMVAAVAGIGLAAVMVRNRRMYGRKRAYTVCALIAAQWLCYGLCALTGFADWTSLVYLPVSGVVWGAIGWICSEPPAENAMEPAAQEAEEKETAPEEKDPFLVQLEAVMREDRLFCNEELTREEVCRRMLTNRTTFSQRLGKAADMTFTEYLREMRLKEAAKLLRETDMPIDQVAYEVGLKSASGFHRNFLLSYGMTPKQYRNLRSNG